MKKALEVVKKGLSRIQYNSQVILTYAIASLAVVIIISLTGDWALRSLFSVYKSSFADPLAYIRVFGHALGHANFEHYFGNILVILMIGPMLEEKYGSRNIAIMMGITALVTGVVHMLFFNTGLTGGSGIVFMLILLSSYANVKKGCVPLTLIVSVAVFLGREVMGGLQAVGNISYTTHVLGGLCGAAFGFVLNGKSIGKEKEKEKKKEKKAPESGVTEKTAPSEDENAIIDLTGKDVK